MQPPDTPQPRIIVLRTGLFEGALGLLAILLGWLLDQPLAATVRLTPHALGLGAAATVPLLAAICLCVWLPLRPIQELVRIVKEILAPLFAGCQWWDLALISVLAGLGEEMLFRGVIQQRLASYFGGESGTWAALVVTSAVFGLLHAITWTYAILAALIGFYLGWLWVATGNLLVPIATHALYDFLVLVYLVRLQGRQAPPPAEHDTQG
jgi:hypothetical protein